MKKKLLIMIMILLMALPSVVMAADVDLGWDKVTESIEGINIYYKSGTPGPPYEARITINDPNAIKATIPGLDPNQVPYFFTATAFKKNGLESDYSGEVVADDLKKANPLIGFEILRKPFKEITETTTETMTKTTTIKTIE